MARVRFGKAFLVGVMVSVLGAWVTSAHGSTITFAQFASFSSNSWQFSNSGATSTLKSSGNTGIFFSNQGTDVLDYSGTGNLTINATVTGPAAINGSGTVTQGISGILAFTNSSLGSASDNLLTVGFTGVIEGTPIGSTALAIFAIPGTVTFSSEHLIPGASFSSPLDLVLSMSTIPGVTINANGYLNNFTATPSGAFQASDASLAPTPEPASLSLAALAVPFLLGRRRARVRHCGLA